MIKIENVETYGWEAAIRGMRNPMNSWDKSDSKFGECSKYIGPNDLQLMRSLAKGGPVHAKFRRMLTITMDITAPLYWWKEFDTYKVGTVANSCSTMHKIAAKEFTIDDFSHEHLHPNSLEYLKSIIFKLNEARNNFIKNHDKDEWWQMIQLLPSSYNQKRTVLLNYEVASHIYPDRKNHKLDEWHVFCEALENLPLSELIIGGNTNDPA